MDLPQLINAVIAGNAPEAKTLTEAALAEGVAPGTIVNEGLIAAMGVVGERFGRGEIYVPEMLLAARAMQTGLTILEPLMAKADIASRGTVVIGTVKGDVHDIGKNIVAIMLKGSGFTVHDLGVDVPAERFVEAIQEHSPDLIGLSALLTTTMPAMKTVIEAIEHAGLRDRVRVMVGGAPITEEYARSVGADGYGRDAGEAAEQAKQLIAGVG
ncbi:MAG: corrinoid protein [Acidimicrobiales bacterium]|jgi:5-methyltetrahydrofolate--homocysteine methyltransferase